MILAEVALTPKASPHSLGGLMDPGLLLDSQVGAVARSAYYNLHLGRQLCPVLDKTDLTMLTHALIISGLKVL